MSLTLTSRCASSTPAATAMLMAIERLLRLRSAINPARRVPMTNSPALRSTLITSAPLSANARVAAGPATTHVKSSTRMPSSAKAISADPFRMEDCEFVGRDAEFTAEDLQVVFANQRRPAVKAPRRAAEQVGRAGIEKLAP